MNLMYWIMMITIAVIPYGAIGWKIAKRDMPRLWREKWEAEQCDWCTKHDEHVAHKSLSMMVLWAVRVPLRALHNTLNEAVDKSDPEYLSRLETSLGIEGDGRDNYLSTDLDREIDAYVTQKEKPAARIWLPKVDHAKGEMMWEINRVTIHPPSNCAECRSLHYRIMKHLSDHKMP